MQLKRVLLVAALGVVAGLVADPQARAGTMFSYVSTVNVAADPTLPANPPGFGASVIGIGSSNSLTFTTNSEANLDAGFPGGADVNYGGIIFTGSTNGTIVNYAVNFNYEVTITDLESGLTGTVNFTGKLSGSARGTPRSISGSFSDYDVVPKSIQIGSTVYLVSIQPSFGPGATFDGVLLGNISVVPEPTSCLLLGLGVLGAGLGLRRFRRPIA